MLGQILIALLAFDTILIVAANQDKRSLPVPIGGVLIAQQEDVFSRSDSRTGHQADDPAIHQGARRFWMIYFALVMPALSLISFSLYGLDKRRAEKNRFRLSETRLLVLDLVGGWPGGWLGQRKFRHKTRKLSYRIRFVLAAILHVGATIYCLGSTRINQFLGSVVDLFTT